MNNQHIPGNQYIQFVTGSAGTFTYNLIATDYGPTTNQLFNSTQISITVSNSVSVTLVGTPSAPNGIDAGNTITFNAFASGGTGSFTYVFYVYNSITNSVVNTFSTGSTNSFVFTTNTNLVGNTLNANVLVTSGASTQNSILVGPYTVNAAVSITLAGSPSAPCGIDAGNTITFNALVSGGTGPFTYTFYVYNSITKSVVNTFSAGSTNSFVFTTNANLVGSTLNANVFVTDGDGRSANSILVGPYTINAAVSITLVGSPLLQAT